MNELLELTTRYSQSRETYMIILRSAQDKQILDRTTAPTVDEAARTLLDWLEQHQIRREVACCDAVLVAQLEDRGVPVKRWRQRQ